MKRAPFLWSSPSSLTQNNMPINTSLSNLLNAEPFRPQASLFHNSNHLSLSEQQKVLVTGGIAALQQHQQEAKERQMVNRRTLSRTTSCGMFPQTNGTIRPSALHQHRALQRSASFDSNPILNFPPFSNPTAAASVSGATSPGAISPAATPGLSNGYRSRETGVVEKLLVSYGFIKCADREGRLFFHYSQYHGEAQHLHISDEVEFEVSMDNRTGKPVAVQVVQLQKGTVVFEVLSEERILGEVTNPAPPLSLVPGQALFNAVPGGTTGVAGHGYKPSEKGEPVVSRKLGSLSYERMGEFFFLHYSANDLTNPNLVLQPGDKVSFNIATEKRTGVMRARKITLVERAPPKRFMGIVTAMKDSFGFIERSDVVKEIFFHYSEVSSNVPDLHVGDHVEFSVQERNNKDVATDIRLLPIGSVQLEQISDELFIGSIEKPLPTKAPNKAVNESTIAGGDATSPNQKEAVVATVNGSPPQQPSLSLAGVLCYVNPKGETCRIRFGEKDRAANCLHTLRQGDKVSFLTITDKRNGQQRAAGVTLLLEETLAASKEKREQGIVAAVKEGFGFIKCVERDSRLFFHCCELLDPTHHIRMSDEVEFTVLLDPVAEKQRMHATRIRLLSKGSVIFHTVTDDIYQGIVETIPGGPSPNVPAKSPNDCLFSPALGPNPGIIVYTLHRAPSDDEDADSIARIPFSTKDFREWMDALSLKQGDKVEFKICEVKRTNAQNAVDIRLVTRRSADDQQIGAGAARRTFSSSLSSSSLKLAPLFEETSSASSGPDNWTPQKDVQLPSAFKLDSVPVKKQSPAARDTRTTLPVNLETGGSDLKETKSPVAVNEPLANNVSGKNTTSSNVTDQIEKMDISIEREPAPKPSSESRDRLLGWVSTLKETFGFIETRDHGSEIFFHYSEMQSPVEHYKVATPVSYVCELKEEKAYATKVEILASAESTCGEVLDENIVKGKVLKPLKSVNPGQSSYQGLIEYKETNQTDETTIKTILFSPLSLSDRRDFIQIGDKVTFQVSNDPATNAQRAVNVRVSRETVRATVDSIKGDFGFINYEVKGGESSGGNGKLFFHMSEVRDSSQQISAGSTVEFSVIYNQRSGKFSASRLRLADPSHQAKQQRPERLRLRSTCDNTTTGPVVSVVRMPRGPTESATGFALARNVNSAATDNNSIPTEATDA